MSAKNNGRPDGNPPKATTTTTTDDDDDDNITKDANDSLSGNEKKLLKSPHDMGQSSSTNQNNNVPQFLADAITPRPPTSSATRREEMNASALGQEYQPPSKKTRLDRTHRFSHWKVGNRYEIMRVLGQGSYGEVVQARDKFSSLPEGQNYVAIKRITRPFDQEIEATRIYREITILRRLQRHECVIQLLDIIAPDDYSSFTDLYLIFEYVDTDLHKIFLSPQYLSNEHVKIFLYQMLKGLKYLESASVIHRDLKPANILLNEDCTLKICDFGLARVVRQATNGASVANNKLKKSPLLVGVTPPAQPLKRQLTKHVVTRWYRAPELILMQPYSSAVDMWSLGCILGELLNMQEDNVPAYQDRQPLFPGGKCAPLSGEVAGIDDRLDQLSVIFSVIGTPTKDDVKSIGSSKSTAEYILRRLKDMKPNSLRSKFPGSDPDAIDLLIKMLQFDPSKRCSVDEALDHKFIRPVRRKESEKILSKPLSDIMDDFVKVDRKVLKQRTYEELLWYKRRNNLSFQDSKTTKAKPS